MFDYMEEFLLLCINKNVMFDDQFNIGLSVVVGLKFKFFIIIVSRLCEFDDVVKKMKYKYFLL